MTVTQKWDLAAGALYLRLAAGRVARTAEISDDVNVDLDAAGKVLGIEVLAPDSRWPLTEIIHRYRHLISDGDMRELIAGYPFRPPVMEVLTAPDSAGRAGFGG